MAKHVPRIAFLAHESDVRAISPKIDGEFIPATTEWIKATVYTLSGTPTVKAYIMNDDRFLYVAFSRASSDGFVSFNVFKDAAGERIHIPVIDSYAHRKMLDRLEDADLDGTYESYTRREDSGHFIAAMGTVTEFKVPLANLGLSGYSAGDAIKIAFGFVEHGAAHVYPTSDLVGNKPSTYADHTLTAATLTDVEVFEVKSPVSGLIHSIRVYCRDIVGTASCRVKRNGTAICAATTPAAGTESVVEATDPFVNPGDKLTVHVTTDGSGSFTDLSVTIVIKQQESITQI